jgi:hypothetical protein
MSGIDWAIAKGVADEPHIDRFVRSIGGEKISDRHSNATFQNADYFFYAQNVIIELKIINTEFGDGGKFYNKVADLYQKSYGPDWMARLVRGHPLTPEFRLELLKELKAPLARIAKKANKQIRETRRKIGMADTKGVFWLVNDNFKSINIQQTLALLGNILSNSYSSLDASIYLTNFYVDIPGDDVANIMWVPMYRDADSTPDLCEFVNWLGKRWFDFAEAEDGPVVRRLSGPDLSITGARPIGRRHRWI